MKRIFFILSVIFLFQLNGFGQKYVDDIYYSPKDDTPTKAEPTTGSKNNDSYQSERKYGTKGTDTIYYTRTQRDDDGNLTGYSEGYYLGNDTESNSDYEYSTRIRRFHNPTIIIDDPYYDCCGYYPYYNNCWGCPGWSVSVGFGWGWGWGYYAYNPWYWGGYYPYYYPYYYSYYPYYPHYYKPVKYTHTENSRRNTYYNSSNRYGRTSYPTREGNITSRSYDNNNSRGANSRDAYNNSETRGSRGQQDNSSRTNNSTRGSRSSDSYNNAPSTRSYDGGSRSSGGSYNRGSYDGGSRSSGGSFNNGGGSYSGGSRGGGRR